jgi:hypothetical protein
VPYYVNLTLAMLGMWCDQPTMATAVPITYTGIGLGYNGFPLFPCMPQYPMDNSTNSTNSTTNSTGTAALRSIRMAQTITKLRRAAQVSRPGWGRLHHLAPGPLPAQAASSPPAAPLASQPPRLPRTHPHAPDPSALPHLTHPGHPRDRGVPRRLLLRRAAGQ